MFSLHLGNRWMTAEMFSVIHSRKSHAYISVFVRTGNEAWWLQISIETCLHIIWHSHLSIPCSNDRGQGVQRRSGAKHRWQGGGGERPWLPLSSISSYQQTRRPSSAVGWPPNGSTMGCWEDTPILTKLLVRGKGPWQGRQETEELRRGQASWGKSNVRTSERLQEWAEEAGGKRHWRKFSERCPSSNVAQSKY